MPILPFKMNLTNELSIWRAQTFYSKEPETLKWLEYFARYKSNPQFIDVGANIGIYSLFFLSLNASTKVICVEPFEKNFSMLKENLILNNFVHRATCIEFPFSEFVECSNFDIQDDREGGSGYKLVDSSNSKSIIKTSTLDSLANIFDTFILKIDTDGNDFKILKGARKCLENNLIDSILIESDSMQQKMIANYLFDFDLIPDVRFNSLAVHSNYRRIANGKLERNMIYSKKSLLN
jgi:FkbM family methyltransferase